MSTRNCIVLKADDTEYYEEGRAAATLKPGYLLEFDASGNLIAHATAGGAAEKKIAREDSLQGGVVTGSYATNDLVPYHICQPGDVLQVVLKAGQNAALGSYLSSNGDGTLKVAGGTDIRLFKAMEALDLTALGDTLTRARSL